MTAFLSLGDHDHPNVSIAIYSAWNPNTEVFNNSNINRYTK